MHSADSAPSFDEPLNSCPICRSANIRRFDHDYRGCVFFRCRDCGVKFMNPQYTDAYLAAYYANYVPVTVEEPLGNLSRRTAAKIDDLEWVERYVAPGRLLAIGCGDGLEITLARDRGWQAEGYDVDADAMRAVAERLQAKTYSGDFVALGLPADSYDCVFLDQVLEHAKNPGEYLQEVRRILKPAGVCFLGCPNIMSLANAWKTFLGKLGLKPSRGKHYAAHHHLTYFSPGVLRRILEKQFDLRVLVVQGDSLARLRGNPSPTTRQARALQRLRRVVPALQSAFRIIAQKPTD
jgi:SAM-dependent methyltransferase